MVCCCGNAPGSNGNSSFGSFIWGMLEPLLFFDLLELQNKKCNVHQYTCTMYTSPLPKEVNVLISEVS